MSRYGATLFYLLLIIVALSLAGCGEDDGICVPARGWGVDMESVAAVPYNDGDQVTFVVSDGSTLTVDFTGGLRRFEEFDVCTEKFEMELRGEGGGHLLSGFFEITPPSNGGGEILLRFDIDDDTNNQLEIELFDGGRRITAGRNPNARVEAELTLNDVRYTDVLVQNYSTSAAGQLERLYYNLDFGLLGFELHEGVSIWRE